MNGLEEMFEAIKGRMEEDKVAPVTERDFDKGFHPIENLKAGDKVRVKGDDFQIDKWPKIGEVIEVYSVDVPPMPDEPGGIVHRNDFTALFFQQGTVLEYAFDSRRFERVEG